MEGSVRLARAGAWAGTGLLAIAAAGLLIGGDVNEAVVTAVFAVIGAALILLPRWVPLEYTLFFVAVVLFDAAGYVFGLFDTVRHFDKAAHFLTTMAVTLTIGYAVYRPMRPDFRRHPLLLFIALGSFGLAVGAAWEVYEYAVRAIGTVGDTVWDLVWDGIGAAVAAAIVVRRECFSGRAVPRGRTVPAGGLPGQARP